MYCKKGWLSVGVGDSLAAIVGSNWGRTRWSRNSSRTVEGSLACLCSMVFAGAVVIVISNDQLNSTEV